MDGKLRGELFPMACFDESTPHGNDDVSKKVECVKTPTNRDCCSHELANYLTTVNPADDGPKDEEA